MAIGHNTLWKMVQQPEHVVSTDKDTTASGFGPAPDLVPPDAGGSEISLVNTGPKDASGVGENETQVIGKSDGFISKLHTINVVSDFPWTHSPEKSREDVPNLILREERIRYNPLFSQVAYNLFNATDMISKESAEGLTKKVGDAMPGIFEGAGKVATLGLSDKAASNMKEFGTSVGDFIKDSGSMQMTADKTSSNFKELSNYRKHLEPYQRLYSTWPTGFKYKFPYFDDAYKDVNVGFSSGPTGTGLPFEAAISKGVSFLSSIVNILNATQPGVYVEAPKYPNFPTNESSYNVSFPLLNTVSYEDTVRNWQLVFLLLYQNLPNRVNRSIILPPKVYEARIPGIWYSRYAYIQSININMKGARRTLDLDMPLGTGMEFFHKKVHTIVPDAYEVNITVKELIPESQNYLFEAIRRSDLVQVDVRDGGGGAAEAVQGGINSIKKKIGLETVE